MSGNMDEEIPSQEQKGFQWQGEADLTRAGFQRTAPLGGLREAQAQESRRKAQPQELLQRLDFPGSFSSSKPLGDVRWRAEAGS